jgi:hypothetical protein
MAFVLSSPYRAGLQPQPVRRRAALVCLYLTWLDLQLLENKHCKAEREVVMENRQIVSELECEQIFRSQPVWNFANIGQNNIGKWCEFFTWRRTTKHADRPHPRGPSGMQIMRTIANH